jgi:hypothetical protein
VVSRAGLGPATTALKVPYSQFGVYFIGFLFARSTTVFQYLRRWWNILLGHRMGTDLEDYIPVHDPSLEIVLNHYTRPLFARAILSTKQLKISRISNVNDPNEWSMIRLIPEQPYEWDGDMSKDVVDMCDKELKLGFTCFSSSCNLRVMWKRYGKSDENTPKAGVCIQFVVRKQIEVDGFPGQLSMPVSYKSRRKDVYIPRDLCARIRSGPIDMDLARSFAPYQFRLLTTKKRMWKGEEEYRVFVQDKDGSGMADFSPALRVTELILGEDCLLLPEAVRDLAQLSNSKSPLPLYRVQGSAVVRI